MSNSAKLEAQGQKRKKILVARLDRIGDVLLSTPVIKALRDAYPESHIAFMARPYARQIVEGNPYLDEVIVYDKDGAEKGFAGNLRFIKKLRDRRFDVAVVLHPTMRTHIVAYMAGIPMRVGYDRKGGFLLTKRIPHTKHFGLKHETDYALDVLRYIGLDSRDRAIYMPVPAWAEESARSLVASHGIKDSDVVVAMNPAASCPSKRWPEEKFAKVATSLSKRHNAKILIVTGSVDARFGENTAALAGEGCVNLSGKTDIATLAAIFRRADLVVSNDSGPAHIACAVGTPVVTIFGRCDAGLGPKRWATLGRHDIALHKDVGCDTCLAHKCRKGFRCLEAVTVEEVVASSEKCLALKQRRPSV